MKKKESSLNIIFHSIIGFIIWIILLIIANILVPYINEPTYGMFIQFFNSLLVLFFILFLIGMVNSLFWNFRLPLNLFAPIFSAILSLFIVSLTYRIFEFIQAFIYFNILEYFPLSSVYIIVFFATLVFGYLMLIAEEVKKAREYSKEYKREIKEKRKSQGLDISWEDVESEFRKVFFNIGEALNRVFDDKKKDKTKKKKR